jgi:glutathione synthase/RimK-type ligase-like ATP-grasp enzyme
MKICFATSEKTLSLTPSDRSLFEAMQRNDMEVSVSAWSDRKINWSEFEVIIIRSCWDYHLRIGQFNSWLNELDRLKIKVFNPIEVLRGNLDKKYLGDLQEKGVRIPTTLWFEAEAKLDCKDILRSQGWQEAVLKPNIGATAYGVRKISLKTSENLFIDNNPEFLNGFMVQKFIPEIETQGEWSIIFFGKEYSHSVIKKTNRGEFRIQYEYGGSFKPANPAQGVISEARSILKYYPDNLLYARIDGVLAGNKFYLMEAELTEPELFISERVFADRFVSRMRELL